MERGTRQKNRRRVLVPRFFAWVMAVAMLAGTISFPVQAEETAETLAAWNYEKAADAPAAGLLQAGAVTGSGILSLEAGPEYTGFSSGGLNSKSWTNGGNWQISNINAAEYENLTFSASMRSSTTGPRKFQLQYSVDGMEWNPVKESDVEVTSKSMSEKWSSLPLPESLEGTTFSLRIVLTDTVAASGDGSAFGAGGTNTINKIKIEGTKSSGGSGKPQEVCAPVTSNIADGEVPAGTVVTLGCDTEGAVIHYTVNGGDENVYGQPITLTEDSTITAYAAKEGYESSPESTFKYTIAETKPATPDAEVGSCLTELPDGAVFVMYNPANKKVMSSAGSRTKLSALDAEPNEADTLTAPSGSAVMKASLDSENGYYTLTCGGKYLTSGATGNSLTFEDTASDYSLWSVEKADDNGGFFVKNVNAEYGGNKNQYIEYYSKYETFTTYGKNSSSKPDAYLMRFYKAKETASVDESVVFTAAQWAGNANYEKAGAAESKKIAGDLYAANDMLDTETKFTAVVNGSEVQPYSTAKSSATGSTSYYMGGKGLGSGKADYIQLALSSYGYGKMGLSFRLRASNTGAGAFQIQYSTDGKEFHNFTTGNYSYKYTAYGADGSSSDVTKSGEIIDGIAKTSLAPANYISFHFDVPAEADHAKQLYIRLVPGTERAKGDGTPAASGMLRMDSVVLTGSPVTAADLCGYVTAAPGAGEISKGSEITLTSATEGADIYYSLNNGKYVKYDETKKPVVSELPATIRTYAKKEGMTDSIKVIYTYTAGKVKSVKATPNGGAVLKDTEVALKCDTDGASIFVSADNGETWEEYTDKLKLTELPKTYFVKATKEGYEDSSIVTLNYTERTNEKYNLYFGQLHSHTNYSDGSGSCEDAYQHASAVDNLDFLAVTDHSNSFDNADTASIADGSVSTEWVKGHALADKYTTKDFVSIFGYEMTWSNGLGHVNTFNTDGFQSRTQSDYTTYSTALQNYYATLKTDADSITQFNHPGTTFGDFSDFSYYDEEIDNLITMIEVGNGEGAVGSSGYFPSYEYYQRALDKGWHVAPTNNQDNHKGLWGDANTTRSVVLADSLTRENIYDAMRNYRVYATEDNDLNIYYTLDGYEMGTILSKDQTGDTVTLKADISDATDTAIGNVQVITNGGLVLDEKNVEGNKESVEFQVNNKYSYYYLKITEADGDIAVTAPVWVGEVEAAGINSISTDDVLPVKGQALKVDLSLYNNETSDMEIESIDFKVDGEVVNSVDLKEAGLDEVAAMGTAKYSFDYTYDKVGSMEMQAVVKAKLNGVQKQYSSVLKLTYVTPEMVTNVIIDGTHYNDYVTGYYGGNVGNFTKIAGNKNIKVNVVTDEITPEMLDDCALLIVSAPAKKNGTANAGDYKVSHFSDEFIQMVKAYTDKGGTLIACGIADYQDTTSGQTATEMNKLLSAVGATTTLNSDEAYDDVNNGGQPYRLYLKNYNADSPYLAGAVGDKTNEDGSVIEGQKYSAYSGCTVNLDADAVAAGKAEPLVTGYDTTYSIDCKDENGNKNKSEETPGYIDKGSMVAIAHEKLPSGANVFVSGTVFISDFEVKAELDNNWDLPYLNKTIADNILDQVTVELPVSAIADVRKANMGDVFTIEGYVTAGTSNENTKFFDAIYLQDDTAGITVFPYAQAGLEIGTKMKITGYVDAYQGDKEIQIISSKILADEEKRIYEPEKLSAAKAMDYEANGGKLVEVTGTVTKVVTDAEGTGVAQFWLDDGSGSEANVFIDGYILSGTTGTNQLASIVKEGAKITAAGIVYMHPEGSSDESVTCIRVRDCDEIKLAEAGSGDGGNTGDNGNSGNTGNNGNTGNSGNTGNTGNSGNNGNTGNSSNTGTVTAKTGDQAPVMVCALFLILSGAAIMLVVVYRRKVQNRK